MTLARMFWIGALVVTATLRLAATEAAPQLSVRERDGLYEVLASFTVPHSAHIVRAVLTDYDGIPRFMPGVESSRVLLRRDGIVRVEQQAVSKYMMFSKRVHLVLDIDEGTDRIRFRDRCNRSFTHYEGVWTITSLADTTEVSYQLTAKPSFGVPRFVLRKLLDRDARAMIDGLRTEFAARAAL